MAARSLEGISHENNLSSDVKMTYRSQFKLVVQVRWFVTAELRDYNKMKLVSTDGATV